MLHMESMDHDRDSCEVYVCMRKGITMHACPKKEAYQAQNTKIRSSHRVAFFEEKGIMLICAMQRIDQFPFHVDRKGDPDLK